MAWALNSDGFDTGIAHTTAPRTADEIAVCRELVRCEAIAVEHVGHLIEFVFIDCHLHFLTFIELAALTVRMVQSI